MPSDDYLNHPEDVKEMEKFGVDVQPVDLQHGFVPTDKYAPDNLEKVEDNIKHRFSL
jgi:hypothetical protein